MASATTRTVRQAARPAPRTDIPTAPSRAGSPARWIIFLAIPGLYLTLRGYHAFDGDQAYRLPLLLHLQDPTLYATDPFVRAFDAFNPHRGYLALIDLASRPFGLAAGLAGLFALTFWATASGVDRLARSAWPELGGKVGLVAFVLVLMAKAGNVGTNHLFESTLLDRLIGFGLGWMAIASAVGDPRRGAWSGAAWLGLAALVHPSVGLQLALTLAVAWGVWGLVGRSGVSFRTSVGAVIGLGLALGPGLALMSAQGGSLFEGLPPEEFRLLSVQVQGPQHMLPSMWRSWQWMAWDCYPILALLALGRVGLDGPRAPWPASRVRLAVLIGVNLASLGLAYLAVEVVGDIRVTVFQPFRMATLARGLALIAVSGRVVTLWARGDLASRSRAVLVGVGLSGDGMLIVATAVDLGMALADWAVQRPEIRRIADGLRDIVPNLLGLVLLGSGLYYLSRHDTESGHWPLIASIGVLAVGSRLARRWTPGWTPRRIRLAMVAAWALPVSAAVAPMIVDPAKHRIVSDLVARCRFSETPTDDLERLAVWARDRTPASSRFIGPPGPKTFRLWSRRPLAFNRAGGPYHAAGLLDWSTRYRDHVDFRGSTTEFARAYLGDRHRLEARYQEMTDLERASLARRQGATHVLAAAPRGTPPAPGGPLELLRVEGRYAVYRVRTTSFDPPVSPLNPHAE
ncbi:DUF6798 domain-containing protein [Tundrisphaera lichenicola]|uniref:DUF6798 domain-containing protein n=1 Tax=Tundrisphaera lichenicola TaxID=2029860 RepID=UPI003EBD673C